MESINSSDEFRWNSNIYLYPKFNFYTHMRHNDNNANNNKRIDNPNV